MNANDFEIALGDAAQEAVWKTPHPLTLHLAEDDPLRVQYLREYQLSVGRQVLAAIENLARQEHRSLYALAPTAVCPDRHPRDRLLSAFLRDLLPGCSHPHRTTHELGINS